MGAQPPHLPPRARTIIYIDGFNLYYGAVRAAPALRWLNLERYCRHWYSLKRALLIETVPVPYCKLLRPNDDIVGIRYFSALVSDPADNNQETYLRALSTTPLVQVILGKFKFKNVKCGFETCTSPGSKWFQVPEEKRTDVNIAVFMLDDAYQDMCDQMIIFSGDSDLVPAINMVRNRFPAKKIIVYVPSRNPVRGAAVELRTAAHANRTLPLQLLSKSQFPDQLQDGSGGLISRPAAWK